MVGGKEFVEGNDLFGIIVLGLPQGAEFLLELSLVAHRDGDLHVFRFTREVFEDEVDFPPADFPGRDLVSPPPEFEIDEVLENLLDLQGPIAEEIVF